MENDFFKYLQQGGRSDNAANRITGYVHAFAHFLDHHRHQLLETASPADLEAFVTHLEQQPKGSAKGQLWGRGYYFAFTTNENLRQLARMLREQRKLQRPFPLREFRGLSQAVVEQLAANGIIHVKHMLTAGNTAAKRAALATSTGVPELVILVS